MPFVLLMLGVVTLAVALGSKKTPGGEPRTYMLDTSLPPPLRDQVLAALASERDPAKLEAFAAAMQTQFPIAASQLRARAQELRAAGAPSGPAIPFPVPVPNAAPVPVPVPSIPIPIPSAPSIPFPVPPPPAQPQAPAAPPPAPLPPSQPPMPGLDPGMPPEVAQAVTAALTTENDPAKLRSFAASLAPRFPIAAGLLNAKANALSLFQPPSPLPPPQPAPAPTPVGPAPVPTAPIAPEAASGFAIVTTQDPPPLGDLRVFDRPNGTQIGGVEKNGTVAVLGVVQDGQTPWARIAWAGGPRLKATSGFVRQQFLRSVAAPAPPAAPFQPFPSPSPAPFPGGAPSLPPGAGAVLAVVTTQDPPPLGDLRVFDRPNGTQIGGAEKNGTVAVLGTNQDGQNQWARIAWAGGPRQRAVTGFVRQQFLRPLDTPLAPSSLQLPPGLPPALPLPPGLPAVPTLPTFVTTSAAQPRPATATAPATSGATYVTKPGDFPIKIAQQLTGDGNRWKELVAANSPPKKLAPNGTFAQLLPGEILKLPASWSSPAAASKGATSNAHA